MRQYASTAHLTAEAIIVVLQNLLVVLLHCTWVDYVQNRGRACTLRSCSHPMPSVPIDSE